jgi:hypothetical protein
VPALRNHTHCQVAQKASALSKTCQRVWLPNRTDRLRRIKHENTTMCIVHKGFRGFRALSPASVLGGNLTGLKPAIPYDTIHSTLAFIKKKDIKWQKQ